MSVLPKLRDTDRTRLIVGAIVGGVALLLNLALLALGAWLS